MAQYDVNLREYWRIIRKRKSIVLIIAVLLGIFSTAFAILSVPVPLYSTDCMIEFKRDRVEGIYSKSLPWDDSDDIETQIAVIKSFAVFEKVAEHMGLIPRAASSQGDNHSKSQVIATIESLQSKVEVTRLKFSSVLSIKVTDHSPSFAQRLGNTVALVYRELHDEQQMKRTKEALRYIEDQMREVRERLRDAEGRFNRFSKDNELISIDLQSETLLKQTKDMQGELAKTEEENAELQELLKRLRGFIENPIGAGHNFDSIKANNRYQSANDTLVGLLLKRGTLLKDYTPMHPEVVAVGNEIFETARKMEHILELQLRGLEKRQSDSSKELEKVDQKTKSLLDKKLEYGRLKREVDLYTDMTTLLERKNQEALIRRSEKPEEVNIVKPSFLPTSPINPPKPAATGATGVVIGLVLGLIAAFIVETFDTSLGAIEDVEQTLGTSVLGVIPHVDLRVVQENIKERYSGRVQDHSMKQAVNLVSHFAPKSMMAESFRALRTNIHFKDTGKKIKSLAITSTSPEEGKTQIVLNMAITMAQSGMRILLVGSDLRKPRLAGVFGVASSPGLSDILLGNYEWRETVRGVTDMLLGEIGLDEIMITPGLDNFFFITGGAVPPNPTELIESPRINQFIEEAKNEYDMILFDTAPIISAVDAAILGTKVDGVLLVYRIGAVPKRLLKRAINQLAQVKANVIGVILNGMRPEVSPDFDYYKHYQSYYSNAEYGKKQRKKKNLTTFDMGEITKRNTEEADSAKVGGGASKGWRHWKKSLGISLLALAVILLAGGFLWRSAQSDPFKSDDAETGDQKEVVRSAIPEQPATDPQGERVSARPSETMSSVNHRPQPLPSGLQKTSKEVPEEKRLAAVVTPEKAALSLETIPLAEVKKESPVVHMESESVGREIEGRTSERVMADPVMVPSNRNDREIPHPYSLFLISVLNSDLVKETVSQWSKRGLAPYSVKLIFSQGEQYWIYIGCFESRETAEVFKKKNDLPSAIIKNTPYANLVGIYNSLDEVQTQHRKLEELGYSSYSMAQTQNKFRLLVGAFLQKERAQRQYQELKSKGIENQIVER